MLGNSGGYVFITMSYTKYKPHAKMAIPNTLFILFKIRLVKKIFILLAMKAFKASVPNTVRTQKVKNKNI